MLERDVLISKHDVSMLKDEFSMKNSRILSQKEAKNH